MECGLRVLHRRGIGVGRIGGVQECEAGEHVSLEAQTMWQFLYGLVSRVVEGVFFSVVCVWDPFQSVWTGLAYCW